MTPVDCWLLLARGHAVTRGHVVRLASQLLHSCTFLAALVSPLDLSLVCLLFHKKIRVGRNLIAMYGTDAENQTKSLNWPNRFSFCYNCLCKYRSVINWLLINKLIMHVPRGKIDPVVKLGDVAASAATVPQWSSLGSFISRCNEFCAIAVW